jgi:hypothetical protein
MSLAEFLELGSYAVTVFGLPYAAWVFWVEQRKERENEEEEAYQHLSDAYNDFLKVVLDNADLQLRTNQALPDPTPEQRERMLIIFDMLIAFREEMSATEQRRWNSWDDYMREWCRRDDFRQSLPLLLRGEDPDFVAYIRRIAQEETGEHLIIADIHA